MTTRRKHLSFQTLLLASLLVLGFSLTATAELTCPPTPEDEMGPFYRPGAPYRTSVGTGYTLTGQVLSTEDCSPIPAAMIELWMTGPEGRYGDPWRATLFSGADGRYRFSSHSPVDFGSRRPHIHMRISAEGFPARVTQHYPGVGDSEGTFDLILIPYD